MPHSNNLCYEFGPFRLDMVQRVLSRAGDAISITPKATDILALLVQSAGQLIDKESLLREVWPNTFVEEGNVSQNIFKLRQALGDDRSGHKYIETVARRGYRFVAAVKAINNSANAATVAETSLRQRAPSDSPIPARPILAVMPFVNATGSDAIDYLASGVTDSIINNLSRISKLRVMSRTAVFRYQFKDEEPQAIGKRLGVDAVLIGKIGARPDGLRIVSELVDATNGWQLWGEGFDCEVKDILEIQDEITRQLLVTLRLKLTGDEEKRITARYTENADAYQSYLEGRYHWSRYTREGIEKAIGHFRRAIDLDSNYALAYAGIVDCYLRLATNYLPPEDSIVDEAADLMESSDEDNREGSTDSISDSGDSKVKLRHEWDWKGAERELRRANELKSDYPAAHQWYAAYRLARNLSERTAHNTNVKNDQTDMKNKIPEVRMPSQIPTLKLTPNEEVQICCAISREQIDSGNYDAASSILGKWWVLGEWPKLESLSRPTRADLLLTTGELAGCLASARQVPKGQKQGESLLNGSIALFEEMGASTRVAEARMELALCYYRQGLFDLGRNTLVHVLERLPTDDRELRTLALIRLASLERHAGRLQEALRRLESAMDGVGLLGPWATARCYLELASTYKDLGGSEKNFSYLDRAQQFYKRSLYEFEAIGNHRMAGIVENNFGFLMLELGEFAESGVHLTRAQRIFDAFNDRIRRAQVDDTLARLYLAKGELGKGMEAIDRAVDVMYEGDEDAVLAEALTTKGIVLCKIGRFGEAKGVLEVAHRLAFRCGDIEGSVRPLLVLLEEVTDHLEPSERTHFRNRLERANVDSLQPILRSRVSKCLQ